MMNRASTLLVLIGLSEISRTYASKLLFCYYNSFAQHRGGIGKYLPEDLDPYLCTHIIFAFVTISPDGRHLKPMNSNDQGPSGLYKRTQALKEKNPDLKVLLAVGGWGVGSEPFVPMIRSEANRRAWVKNVVNYLRQNDFDGFDMDWEFPATRGSPPDDKERFTQLMKELYEEFESESEETGNEKLLLTCATASGTYYIDQSYEPDEIWKYMDYMLLMTYNYHGHWQTETGHHAGMRKHPLDPEGMPSELNTEWSVDFWLEKGIPKSKLVLGIATYGMSFTLTDPSDNGIRAPATGGGRPGTYTKESGILSYYEVCTNIKENGWQTVWIEEQEAPYAYGDTQWVGYESAESAAIKAENILNNDLAGGFIWSIELDDFNNVCGDGRYPIASVVSKTLLEKSSWGFNAPAHAAHRSNKSPWTPPPKQRASGSRRSSKAQPLRPGTRRNLRRKTTTTQVWFDHPTTSVAPPRRMRIRPTTEEPDWDTATPWETESTTVWEGFNKVDYVSCQQFGIGMFADPANCEYFIMCPPGTWNIIGGVRTRCPDGTKFDVSIKVCNHASLIHC